MKKKLLVYGLSTIGSFLLLTAAFSTALGFDEVTTQQFTNSSSTRSNTNSPYSASTGNLKIESTWKQDVWDETQGYIYLPHATEYVVFNELQWLYSQYATEKSNWTFKLDSNGFAINPDKPTYATVKGARTRRSSGQLPSWPYWASIQQINAEQIAALNIKGDFTLDSVVYNAGAYTKSAQKKHTMNFSDYSDGAKFSTSYNLKTDAAHPFVSINVPYLYFMGNSDLRYSGNQLPKYAHYNNTSYTYDHPYVKASSDNYGANSTMVQWNKATNDSEAVKGYNWGSWKVAPHQFVAKTEKNGNYYYPIDHIVLYLNLAYNDITMFKDYDGATLKGSHIMRTSEFFNTTYDGWSIDESLIDIREAPSKQLDAIAKAITIKGNDIAHNFVRDGSLTFTKIDDENGEVELQFMPKHQFVQNEIVEYTGRPITIYFGNFSPFITKIVARTGPFNVALKKWYASLGMEETGGQVNRNGPIEEYLDLYTVPNGTVLTIVIDPDTAYDYGAGTITFTVSSDKQFDKYKDVVDTPSEDFIITLSLLPQVTEFVKVKDNPDNLAVDQLKAKLFDINNKLNTTEFAKYYEIVSPAPDAEYFLVNDSFNSHLGDGIANFKLYATNYYDNNGNVLHGADDKTSSHFAFALNLNPLPTIIEQITDSADVRVDHFVELLTGSKDGGKITDFDSFDKYIRTENLPSTSELSVANIEYSDWTSNDYRDTVTFDLNATKFNKANNIVDNETIPFTFKLLPQYKPTDVVVKQLLSNPDRVDVFKNKITTLKGDALTTYLKGYTDFTSLRDDAVITTSVADYDSYNGQVKFNVGIENYYDSNSDENTGITNINELVIDLPKAPTEVKIVKAIDKDVRLDRFVKTFADETTGVVNNLAVLQQYVSFDVWDPNTTLTIDIDSVIMDNTTGEWSGNLIMAEANDLNSTRVTNKRFPLQFQLAEKYDPTTIEQLPEYPLVQLDDFRNNLFDEDGFAKPEIFNYLNAYSLPPNAKLRLVKDPVIDYPNAQLTIEVEITSYYDSDSDLQESSPITRNAPWIETFTFDLLSPETNIAVTENYDATPRVDRFAASIKTLTDDDLKAALADYVSFDYLPANTSLSIDQTSMSITNIPGTLKFDVLASRYFDAAGYLQTSIKSFPITLNLADKHATTNITAKTSAELPANKLRVDHFIAALGATEVNPEIINLEVLNQYVNIISIPEGAKLSVDYDELIDTDEKTGAISFSIKVDQYYDADSDLQINDFSFPIELVLAVVHEPTTIIAKTADLPNTRADRLLRTFMDTSTNKVTNFEVLKQYVDITSLPSTAQLFVANPVVNAKLGTISFNLIASQYYDAASDLQTDSLQTAVHPFPISLQLAPKIDATNFTAKTTLPDDVLVNELTQYLAPKGVTNLERFEQYIDVFSLPTNTKIELEETSHSTTTGKISYNIKVKQYYDTEGDLQTKDKSYPVTLQLSPVYAETEIYALDNYPTDLDITTFKQYVVDTSDNVVEDNLKKFVGIVSLPTASQLTIAWGTETDTTIDFIVHASQYYNAQHKLAYDKDFNISLTFSNNVLPTDIKAWPTYPQMAAHQFFKLVNPNNKIDYTQLSKYLDLSTVPFDATLTIANPDANQKTGLVTFDITTSTWYDENKVHQTSDRTFSISLNLTPKYAETNLFGIASVEKDITLDAFWSQISTNNKLDQAKLAQYVNLDSLVPNTKLQYLNPVKSWNGGITFDLVVDRYYDADGTENAGKKVFKIVLNNLAVNLDQKQIDDYTWLYVTLALVFSSLGSLVWFLIAKNKKRKEDNN